MNITFKKISAEKESEAFALLESQRLPTNDIDNQVVLFSLESDGKIIATAGLEQYGYIGLLRSVGVLETEKGNGYGCLIVKYLEEYAKKNKINEMFLLTLTAKDFFEKKCQYQFVERENVASEIQNCRQFVSTCPSSAVVMKKVLA
ncbi:MAG: GNAT family N-acetyltransferase [Emticicia sp.]|uniref:GNAT family N-acetyltransferase n=1 Tax=Emticicia sp. TaxID=1930953 RepID=UPI003BA4206B